MPGVTDTLVRFVVDGAPVRGGVARLGEAYRAVLHRCAYPPRLEQLLGELMAASVLLASTLKFRGTLVAQLQSQGALRLLVVECSDALDVRAMAHWEGEVPAHADLAALTRSPAAPARLVITLDPRESGQLYQGIVEVADGSIAAMLEHYLATSEQLPSRLWLEARDGVACGLLLQRLPGAGAEGDEAWRRLATLASTLAPRELLDLEAPTLLGRLFADEAVRVFRAQPVRFHCPCSAERVAGALRLLGQSEVVSILGEQGEVAVTCEFCNRRYRLGRAEALALFSPSSAPNENVTRH